MNNHNLRASNTKTFPSSPTGQLHTERRLSSQQRPFFHLPSDTTAGEHAQREEHTGARTSLRAGDSPSARFTNAPSHALPSAGKRASCLVSGPRICGRRGRGVSSPTGAAFGGPRYTFRARAWVLFLTRHTLCPRDRELHTRLPLSHRMCGDTRKPTEPDGRVRNAL